MKLGSQVISEPATNNCSALPMYVRMMVRPLNNQVANSRNSMQARPGASCASAEALEIPRRLLVTTQGYSTPINRQNSATDTQAQRSQQHIGREQCKELVCQHEVH